MRSATSSSRTAGEVPGRGPVVLVHGGAWDIPLEETEAHKEGLLRALRIGERAVSRGLSALDVAVEVVASLEDHPAFDAGRGAVLDRDGLPQLDAGVMEGETRRWGAVANVRHIANPIRAARELVYADGQARLLVADGAERFAAEVSLPAVDPAHLVVPRERERFDRLRTHASFHTSQAFAGAMDVPRGTVGCVVLDGSGLLASATSTGGAPLTRSGRVGDSPIPGSGFMATPAGAASATGWGEAILTCQLCADVLSRVDSQAPAQAAESSLQRMADIVRWAGASRATGGLIVVDAEGRAGWAFTTPRMARGAWRPSQDPWVAVS
ncbi:MAG: isoaspartyl peptidase/L-asparaginase [Bacteroidota bacterium]